jgi:hypothetical protein
MDRMAGLALAGAGLGAAGLGVAAATGNLPVSKQQQLEEFKSQGIAPPPELEKEAQDEQLAMLGMAALAMSGGVGLGVGGDRAWDAIGGGSGFGSGYESGGVAGGSGLGGGYWTRGADGAPVPPPGGSGPRPGGGSRMAAEPSTVELVSRLAASSPQMAAEVQAILDRKAGKAWPLRVEATRRFVETPEAEFMENFSGIDLQKNWSDIRELFGEVLADSEERYPSVFGANGVMEEIVSSGVDRSPQAFRELQETIDREYGDLDQELVAENQKEFEMGPFHEVYLMPRNKNIPNDTETGLGLREEVDPMSLRELVSGEPDGADWMALDWELEARKARNEAGDDTYWGPENPHRPPSDASLADRKAYKEHDRALWAWINQEGVANNDGFWALSKGLYGGQPVYNQPDMRHQVRRRGN